MDTSSKNLPDPYTELLAAETAIRSVIRLALGTGWKAAFSSDEMRRLESRQVEEGKRRDGVTVSRDLLDYTEVYHFEKIIKRHWEKLKPILDDRARLMVYLDIVSSVRNTIAHSRPVVPAERLLLAGAAGQIQNQLAEYRSKVGGPNQHYASIDSARDNFGRDGDCDVELRRSFTLFGPDPAIRRIEVGDTIIFELTATDPRGRDVTWRGYSIPDSAFPRTVATYASPMMEMIGSRVRVEWQPTENEVGESRQVIFTVANNGSHHRYRSWDDACMFTFHVNPPSDP